MQALKLKQAGKLQEAYDIYHDILKTNPDQPEALYRGGVLAKELGRFDIGEQMVRRALAVRPDYEKAHYCLAELLHGQKRHEEAEAEYRRILASRPEYAPALINLGNVLRAMEKYNEAAIILRRAVKIAPTIAEAWDILGNTLVVAGELEEARRALEEAVRLRPAAAGFHRNLSVVKTYRDGDSHITLLQELLARPDLPVPDRRDAYYTLSKAYDDMGCYDEAFAYHMEGNRLQRTIQPHNMEKTRKKFADIQDAYKTLLPQADLSLGCSDDTPIFILGMPRSGTTLVAQILSSHPAVYSAGETPHLTETAASFPATTEIASRLAMADHYLKRLRKNAPADARHIIDKMPDNFRQVGLIALILPKARIIHCKRDAMDTCVSIFRTHAMIPRAYGCDLKELGQYYCLYLELMEFWRQVLPGRMYELQYETLVDNLEGESRRLLEHCGLDWQEQCLQFHKTKRNVRTASSVQVRSPLYRSSVGAWKCYERHLGPLKEGLKA